MKTTITVKEDVWEELKKRKKLGETFDDILRNLLKMKNKIKNNENDE